MLEVELQNRVGLSIVADLGKLSVRSLFDGGGGVDEGSFVGNGRTNEIKDDDDGAGVSLVKTRSESGEEARREGRAHPFPSWPLST